MLDVIHPNHADRAQAENFVHDVFAKQYEADVYHFMPHLVRLRYDINGECYSIAGYREALGHQLFVEKYLDDPVEVVLSRAIDERIPREAIVEVGNLAEAGQGGARDAIIALVSYLYGAGYSWGVATIIPRLSNAFRRVGLMPVELVSADIHRLSEAEQKEWGSYYDHSPFVAAMDIRMAYRTLEMYADDFPSGCKLIMEEARRLGLQTRRKLEKQSMDLDRSSV